MPLALLRCLADAGNETAACIGCAGLMADRLVKMLGVGRFIITCPFRGEVLSSGPRHNRIVNHLITRSRSAMPFLGVHLTRSTAVSRSGRNAVLAPKREGYRKRDVSFTDTTGDFSAPPAFAAYCKTICFPGLARMKNSLCKARLFAAVQKVLPSLTVDLQPGRRACGRERFHRTN